MREFPAQSTQDYSDELRETLIAGVFGATSLDKKIGEMTLSYDIDGEN